MSECNKCNGTLFVCENHPDQEAHQCKHCGGAGMPCECTKISELIDNSELLPIAYCVDLEENAMIEASKILELEATDVKFLNTPLYTHPMRELTDEDIDKILKQNDWYSKSWVDMVRSIESAIIKASRGEK